MLYLLVLVLLHPVRCTFWWNLLFTLAPLLLAFNLKDKRMAVSISVLQYTRFYTIFNQSVIKMITKGYVQDWQAAYPSYPSNLSCTRPVPCHSNHDPTTMLYNPKRFSFLRYFSFLIFLSVMFKCFIVLHDKMTIYLNEK